MNRRKALVNLGIITGGMMLLPSCEFSEEKITLALHNLNVTQRQDLLLKDIVKTMIPEGDLPGAESLNVYKFVWVMVDDCLEVSLQKSYINGLNKFDQQIESITGKGFKSLNTQEQLKAFQIISEDSDDPKTIIDGDVKSFLNATKRFSILGYMKSEYIMTEIMPYTLVPTKYGTCDTIDKTKRINING